MNHRQLFVRKVSFVLWEKNRRTTFFWFILFCRITYDPFCPVEIKHRDISRTWFQVCTKVHCCKKHVCKGKTLSGQATFRTRFSGRKSFAKPYWGKSKYQASLKYLSFRCRDTNSSVHIGHKVSSRVLSRGDSCHR